MPRANGGSIGIIGAARTGFVIAKDPDDENRRVLAPTKNNIARMPPALAFSVVSYQDIGTIRWEGESKHTADTLLSPPESEEDSSALQEAKDILIELLREGTRASKEVEAEAKAAGVSSRTFKRAALKVRSTKSGEGGSWEMSLPVSLLTELQAQSAKEAKGANDAKDSDDHEDGTLEPAESG